MGNSRVHRRNKITEKRKRLTKYKRTYINAFRREEPHVTGDIREGLHIMITVSKLVTCDIYDGSPQDVLHHNNYMTAVRWVKGGTVSREITTRTVFGLIEIHGLLIVAVEHNYVILNDLQWEVICEAIDWISEMRDKFGV